MHCSCSKTFALYRSLRYIELHYKDLLLYMDTLINLFINNSAKTIIYKKKLVSQSQVYSFQLQCTENTRDYND